MSQKRKETSTTVRVIKNTGYLYIKMGITMFVSLYTTRLILNGLGASDFGIFNIVGGAIAMLGFLNAAMANATQRFMSYAEGEGNKDKQKQIFNISLVIHSAIAIFIGLVLIVVGHWFFNGILTIPENRFFAAKIVYFSLIVSTVFTVMSVPYDAMLNAHENMRYYAFVGTLESILKLSVAFICVYTHFDKLIVYGILMACIPLITMTLLRIYCHRQYEECVIALKQHFSKSLMKEMTSFAGWAFLTSISSMWAQYGLGIVVNHFFGVILNAAQGIANQVSGMLQNFSYNIMKAVNPVLVKSEGAHDRQRLQYITFFGCRVSFWIMAMFEIPMILLAPHILRVWLVNVPIWAVLFTQLQLIQSMSDQLFGSVYSAVYAEGNIKNYAIVKSILNILPLPTTFILYQQGFPPYWLYITWILFWGVLGGATAIWFGHKSVQLSIKRFAKTVILPCLAVCGISTAPFIICHIFCDSAFIDWCMTAICVLIIVVGGWFYILQQEERTKIVQFASPYLTFRKTKNEKN